MTRRHPVTISREQLREDWATTASNLRWLFPVLLILGVLMAFAASLLGAGARRLPEAWSITVGAPAFAAWSPEGIAVVYVTSGDGRILWVKSGGLLAHSQELGGRRVLGLSPHGVATGNGTTLQVYGSSAQGTTLPIRGEPAHVFLCGNIQVLARPVLEPHGVLGDHLEIVTGSERWTITLAASAAIGAARVGDGVLVTTLSTVGDRIQAGLSMLSRDKTSWQVPLGERLPAGPVSLPGGAVVAVGDLVKAYTHQGAEMWTYRLPGDVDALEGAGSGVLVGVAVRSLLGNYRHQVIYLDYQGNRRWSVTVGGPVEQLHGDDHTVAVLAKGLLWLVDVTTGKAGRFSATDVTWVAVDSRTQEVVTLTTSGEIRGLRLPGR
ncbi:MAG: hypothetical protein AB1445_08215 [Bacillota bacterium]